MRHLLYLQCKPEIIFISKLPHESQLGLFIEDQESSRNYFRSPGWLNAHTTGKTTHLYPDTCTGISITEQSSGKQTDAAALQLNIWIPADKGWPLVPKGNKSSSSSRASAGGDITRVTLSWYWELKSLFLLQYLGLIPVSLLEYKLLTSQDSPYSLVKVRTFWI